MSLFIVSNSTFWPTLSPTNSVLLHDCTNWNLTKQLEKKNLDGNYTRMLCAVLDKYWKQNPAKQQLQGHLPPISQTIPIKPVSSLYTYTYTHKSWLNSKSYHSSALCGHWSLLEELPRRWTIGTDGTRQSRESIILLCVEMMMIIRWIWWWWYLFWSDVTCLVLLICWFNQCDYFCLLND